MSNNNHLIAAIEHLYAFRAGQFYKPKASIVKYITNNKIEVISEILNLPLGCRINQGAIIRDKHPTKLFTAKDWIDELSFRSWRYFGSDIDVKAKVVEQINAIDHNLLCQTVSDFIESNFRIDASGKISLSIYGGYLWNESPNDLDLLVVIDDQSL